MDIINVFIIVGREWSRDKVVRELIDEGYSHNFYFGESDDIEKMKREMDKADEIWTFGNCDKYLTYNYALKNTLDIWRMG